MYFWHFSFRFVKIFPSERVIWQKVRRCGKKKMRYVLKNPSEPDFIGEFCMPERLIQIERLHERIVGIKPQWMFASDEIFGYHPIYDSVLTIGNIGVAEFGRHEIWNGDPALSSVFLEKFLFSGNCRFGVRSADRYSNFRPTIRQLRKRSGFFRQMEKFGNDQQVHIPVREDFRYLHELRPCFRGMAEIGGPSLS